MQWNVEIGARFTTVPETRPRFLVEDKYAIAVINNEKNCWTCSTVLYETDILLS